MNHKRLIWLFLMLSSILGNAQNRYVDSLLNWLKENPAKDTQRVMNTHRLSYRLSEIDASKSWSYAKETEQLAKEIGFKKGECVANINYAILEGIEGNFQNSADYYLKAIEIAEKIKFTRGLSISYNNIGENYTDLNDHEKALIYFEKALVLNNSIREMRGQAINLENIGNLFFKKKNYSKALNYWTKGFEFARKADNPNPFTELSVDMANYYIVVNNIPKAFQYLHIADSISINNGETLYRIYTYKAYANAFNQLKQFDSSLKYLHHAKEFTINLGNKNELSSIYKLIYETYEKINRPDSAIYYLKKNKAISDSVLSEKNLAHIAFLETKYETDLKERENDQLRQLKKKQDRQIIEKNWLLIASLIALFLAFLSIFLVIRVFKNNKKSLEIEEQNKISAYKQQVAELEVKSLRSQMNPHFLFNSLNSIRNYIIKNEPQLASDYLANFAKLMRKILDASQQSKIALDEEVDMLKLYLDLELMRFSNRFTYSIHVDPEIVDVGLNIPSMAIQPFIENAIWHGLLNKEDGEEAILQINYFDNQHEVDRILCEVIDNGIGRAQSNAMKSQFKLHKSKGISITTERLRRLSGNKIQHPIEFVDLYDKDGKAIGTKVKILLPVL